MIKITTGTKSFLINDERYQLGDLSLFYQNNGNVKLGNYSGLVSDYEVDGQVFSTTIAFDEYIKDKLYRSNGGGGSGSGVSSVTGTLVTGTDTDVVVNNPLLEFHRVIITDGTARDITDFGGTITLVTNGIVPATNAQLNWKAINDETRKLTIIFTFDCAVTNTTDSGVQAIRLPTSAINGDVWEVVWDKFYNIWNLVSVNNTASFDPVPDLAVDNFLVGSASGNIGRKILRGDLSLNNGQVLATNPSTGALVGINWSIAPIANGIPVRTNGGNLQSGVSVLGNDVVIKSENPTGTERDIRTWDASGNAVSKPINIQHLTDIGGFPSFSNGILTATAMNAVDKTGLLSFIEMSTGAWKASTIPMYNSQGGLSVGNPVQSTDAVPLMYFNQRIPEPPSVAGVFKLVSNGGVVSWVADV